MSDDLPAILEDIRAEMATRTERGKVATYIPELATIDPNQFALSVVLADGSQHSTGDFTTPFSIQPISRVFALAIALGHRGDRLWARAFGACLQLDPPA